MTTTPEARPDRAGEINGLAIPNDAAKALRQFGFACRQWGLGRGEPITQDARDAEGELIGVISRLESDRLALAAECERMTAVVEAAVKFRQVPKHSDQFYRDLYDLQDAVDAYLTPAPPAATSEEGES